MDKSDLLRLKNSVSSIRSYAELYEDLHRTPMTSKEVLEIIKIKMEHCREQILSISLDLKNYFSDLQAPASAESAESISSLGAQMMKLMDEICRCETQKDALLTKLEKVFLDYHSGRSTYFEYVQQLSAALEGRRKEEWLISYDRFITGLVADVMSLNERMFYSAHKAALHNELRITAPDEKKAEIAEARPAEIISLKIKEKPAEALRPDAKIIKTERPVKIPAGIKEPETELKRQEPKKQQAVKAFKNLDEAEEVIGKVVSSPVPKQPVEKAPVEMPAKIEPLKQTACEKAAPGYAVREEIEDEKDVEELLSKLKSGEVSATPNVMKWLVERLKKQKPKELSKETALDFSLLEGGQQDFDF